MLVDRFYSAWACGSKFGLWHPGVEEDSTLQLPFLERQSHEQARGVGKDVASQAQTGLSGRRQKIQDAPACGTRQREWEEAERSSRLTPPGAALGDGATGGRESQSF